MADAELELRPGGRGGVTLLTLPAFLPAVIFSLLTQNKGRGWHRAPPADPPLICPLIIILQL